MNKKTIFGLFGALGLVLILALFKGFQIYNAIQAGKKNGPPPQAITTYIAKKEIWPYSFRTIANLNAVNGTLLSAEEAGLVKSINFQSGDLVEANQVLVELDTAAETAQLEATRAQLELAEINAKRMRALRANNATSQSDLDSAETNLTSLKAESARLQALIRKKQIIAPFSGKTGVVKVYVGQMVEVSTPIVELQNNRQLHIDFNLPQAAFSEVSIGNTVRVISPDNSALVLEGKLTSFDSKINSSTRNFALQATIDNNSSSFQPGMFVNVELLTNKTSDVITVPVSSISFAPYGNSIYVVAQGAEQEPRNVSKQIVQLGKQRGDLIAVLSGINENDEIVSSGSFKIIPGGTVIVNNSVQPGSEQFPNPKNT